MKVGDKVTSSSSLWGGDVGEVWGITSDDLIWVKFPENDRHEAYMQSFRKDQLRNK